MQLNSVVLPAPFGPMIPTISHRSARRDTSERACTPPKRIDTCEVSRTVSAAGSRSDIVDRHLLVGRDPPEAAAGQPLLPRAGQLPEAAREAGEHHEQEDGPEHQGGELG